MFALYLSALIVLNTWLPALSWQDRLPTKQQCQWACQVNREYRCHLQQRFELQRYRADLLILLEETDRRYRLFDLCETVHNWRYRTVLERRLALNAILQMMEPDDFCLGRWPMPFPFEIRDVR